MDWLFKSSSETHIFFNTIHSLFWRDQCVKAAHLFVLAGIIEILLDDLFGINKTGIEASIHFCISLTDKISKG
jgi:hypothetical protein